MQAVKDTAGRVGWGHPGTWMRTHFGGMGASNALLAAQLQAMWIPLFHAVWLLGPYTAVHVTDHAKPDQTRPLLVLLWRSAGWYLTARL